MNPFALDDVHTKTAKMPANVPSFFFTPSWRLHKSFADEQPSCASKLLS